VAKNPELMSCLNDFQQVKAEHRIEVMQQALSNGRLMGVKAYTRSPAVAREGRS